MVLGLLVLVLDDIYLDVGVVFNVYGVYVDYDDVGKFM